MHVWCDSVYPWFNFPLLLFYTHCNTHAKERENKVTENFVGLCGIANLLHYYFSPNSERIQKPSRVSPIQVPIDHFNMLKFTCEFTHISVFGLKTSQHFV